jgi:hypothetical protein
LHGERDVSVPISTFTFGSYKTGVPSPGVGFNFYANFQTDWFWYSYNASGVPDLVAYYANLLIIQYNGKPNANAHISTLVTPVIMNEIPTQVMNGFNLTGGNIAIGKQLDILAKYVGVQRSYVGFNGQTITLSDSDFLTLINMGIIRNNAGSSMGDIEQILNQYFSGEIYAFDYGSMTMGFLVNSSIGSENVLQLFVTEGLLPVPMGVGYSVISNSIINKFFGMRTYFSVASPLATPFNTYGQSGIAGFQNSYQSSWLAMSYAYAVV